ncbi:hypothetical protein SAMN04490248_10247 [Salinihabitans flavidus]|uniref:Uncharacterized protein n=1 Tax=Salinihabitans flavidus TaxID=569882 RepID=A0A1H8MEA4_9RHOB|nr:hypothetical protein [Salinihabitans flavidus]SEO15687.1 hypothetical protein SAMN04490248_10247 [Salinihabitans flavidus]
MSLTVQQLVEDATAIEGQLAEATGSQKWELHQQLHRTLEAIKLRGGKVPARLHELDLDLLEEAVEDGFDNVPI